MIIQKILQPDAEFMASVLMAHEAIHAAIASGNAQLASDRMLSHVNDVETYLLLT